MSKTSNEVKNRWKQRNYQQYNVSLRHDTDSELIAFVEFEKASGKSTTEIFREAVKQLKKNK